MYDNLQLAAAAEEEPGNAPITYPRHPPRATPTAALTACHAFNAANFGGGFDNDDSFEPDAEATARERALEKGEALENGAAAFMSIDEIAAEDDVHEMHTGCCRPVPVYTVPTLSL